MIEGIAGWSAVWRSFGLSYCAILVSIGFEATELEGAAFGWPFLAFWALDFDLFLRC